MSIKIISEYLSDDGKRTSTVYKVLEDGDYRVSVKNESGSNFSSSFDSVDTAEDFAEDWVKNV
jgi:hypothetical protein